MESNKEIKEFKEMKELLEETEEKIEKLALTDDEKEDSLAKNIELNNSDGKELIMLNGYVIKKNYPKAFKALIEWMKEETQNAIDISDDFIASLLLYQARALYDFFDKKEIYVNISGCNSKGFLFYIYDVNGKGIADDNIIVEDWSRIKAEEAAFTEAFKILNNQ